MIPALGEPGGKDAVFQEKELGEAVRKLCDTSKPGAALERHAQGEIDLAPPTWITLYHLSRYGSVDAVLERLGAQPTRFYETRLGVRTDGTRIAMWHGDACYASSNADVEGARHRLVMAAGGFEFENTVEAY